MDLNKKYNLAVNYLRSNQIPEAEKIFLQIHRKKPKDLVSIENLVKIYLNQKDFDNALKFLLALFNLTGDINAIQNLIILNFDLKRYVESENFINVLLRREPKNFIGLLYKAKILTSKEIFDQAAEIYEENYLDFSQNKIYLQSYAFLLNRTGDYKKAIEIYTSSINLDPDDFMSYFNLGVCYGNLSEYEDAEKAYKKAINLNKTFELGYINLSAVYMRKLMHIEAKECIEELFKINKNNYVGLHTMGLLLSMENKLLESVEYFKKALLHNPVYTKSHFQLGLVLLRLFRFDDFSEHYRWRTRDEDQINSCQIQVDDFDIDQINKTRKLIIYHEQGLGDQLFYSRFIKHIPAKKIILVVHRKLKNFMKQELKDVEITDLDDERNFKLIDFQKINLASTIRYISKDKISKDLSEESLKFDSKKEKIHIGLSWKSKSNNYGDSKSFPLEKLLKKINRGNMQFINLQYGDTKKELEDIDKNYGIKVIIDKHKNITDEISDLKDLITQCDLVITCSNVTAHVAGFLRKQTFLLAPSKYGRLWFWDADESGNSIWYPSVKIISNENDDWNNVFEQLNNYLIKL